MADLTISSPSGTTQKFSLSRIKTTIGRSVRNDICIPDAFASRLHAEIRQEPDGYWLHDLGSANGTRLNGLQVKEPEKLSDGYEIRIGENLIVFREVKAENERASVLVQGGTDSLDPTATISFSFKQRTTDLLDAQVTSRNDLLALISKVGIALLSAEGLEDTFNQVANLVFDAVPAQRCVIMLKDVATEGGVKIATARMRGQDEPLAEVRISRTVMDEVLEKRNAVLTADAQHDPRFATQTMMLLGIRSVLAVPLSVDGSEVFGLVYADSPMEEVSFREEHLNILTTLASVAAIRVENARLIEARIERERLERELALATEIQQRFQPSSPPVVEGFDFQGVSFSCYEIGGDYYDFIERPSAKMLIALGDVSGKGTAAALLMSSVHAAVHAQVAADQPLRNIPSRINKYLAENTPSNRFVTLFMGELDPASGSLEYVNAGHNPPMIVRADGGTLELASGGLPLGLLPNSAYEAGDVTLGPGDALVIYSDGVTEAVNVSGEEFGVERLSAVLRESVAENASAIRDRIESALSAFTTTAPASDDITLVIVKRIS